MKSGDGLALAGSGLVANLLVFTGESCVFELGIIVPDHAQKRKNYGPPFLFCQILWNWQAQTAANDFFIRFLWQTTANRVASRARQRPWLPGAAATGRSLARGERPSALPSRRIAGQIANSISISSLYLRATWRNRPPSSRG
jgi:hypothetical protein